MSWEFYSNSARSVDVDGHWSMRLLVWMWKAHSKQICEDSPEHAKADSRIRKWRLEVSAAIRLDCTNSSGLFKHWWMWGVKNCKAAEKTTEEMPKKEFQGQSSKCIENDSILNNFILFLTCLFEHRLHLKFSHLAFSGYSTRRIRNTDERTELLGIFYSSSFSHQSVVGLSSTWHANWNLCFEKFFEKFSEIQFLGQTGLKIDLYGRIDI